MLVNFVYDDEELLEPYEWQEDDCFEDIENIPIYHVTTRQLHDFLYGKVYQPLWPDGYMLVGDGHYCFVVDIQKHYLVRRGTLSWRQSDEMNALIQREPVTFFQYHIQEEAYDKEFGLTRQERLKKMCLEEIIDEIFVVKYHVFVEICKQLHIDGNNPREKYLDLKHKIEKGYTSLHELLYEELVQRR